MKSICRLITAASFLWLPALASGYAYSIATSDDKIRQNQISGTPVTWNNPQQPFTFNFGAGYDEVGIAATEEWSAVGTALQFQGVTGTAGKLQICNGADGINNAGWSSDGTCTGQSFGDSLAVTRRNYQKVGGSWYLADAAILFDSTRTWAPQYNGPLQATQDFHRVILHELGHALGLDHPDAAGQNVVAIMNSTTSSIENLQLDDRNGINKLYGGASSSIQSRGGGGGGGGGDGMLPLLLLIGLVARRIKNPAG